MPRKKKISNLVDLSVKAVAKLVKIEALRVANYVVTHFVYDEIEAADYEETQLRLSWEREVYLSDQVELFKQHLLSHLPHNLLEHTLTLGVLSGVRRAIAEKRRQWTPTTNMTKFTREMYAVLKFANVLVVKEKVRLDLNGVPKMIRTKLYGCLKAFTGLRSLSLGSGSGGWVTEAYSEAFSAGLSNMSHLTTFSLKYDCTDTLLRTLTENCSRTLTSLDIERCGHITDESADSIVKCSRLKELNMFRTGLSDEGLCQVLCGLKDTLVYLPRGDYLCDVLDDLDDTLDKNVKFKIVDFWASEEYYFHHGVQMERAARRCPNITKMLFMFQEHLCRLSILSEFKNLKELDLWGGRFYSDELCDLLEMIGPGLTKLSLVHIEEIDERALAWLTFTCPNLEVLGLHSCEFVEDGAEIVDLQAFAERMVRAEEIREISKLSTPMLDVKIAMLASKCSAKQIVFLLRLCLNVKEIFLGMNTAISDKVIDDILLENRLQKLETLTIQGCSQVTMRGVETLLDNCDNLRELGNLAFFTAIHPMELKMLAARIREENMDLELDSALNKADDDGDDDGLDDDFVSSRRRDLSTTSASSAPQYRPVLDNSTEWA